MSNIVGGFDLDKIPQPVKDAVIGKLEAALGFTHERAAEFLALSAKEHPEKDAAWHRTDSIGKFKHHLRTADHLQGATDVFWNLALPFATQLVDDVLAHAAVTPTPGG